MSANTGLAPQLRIALAVAKNVNGVVNTITGGDASLRDGFHIRRAAAEKQVPCFTSLDTMRAAAEALSRGNQTYAVQPFPEYRRKEAR